MTVLEKVEVNDLVVEISTGIWYQVVKVPTHPRSKTPTAGFWGKDPNGNRVYLAYEAVREANPFKCTCGQGFESPSDRFNHLDEMWGDGTSEESKRHGIVHNEY